MNIFVDREFVNRLSFKLDGFKQLKPDLWNFRCPLCGDSKKKKSKKRGYIYTNDRLDSNKLFYKCQNCSVSIAFHSFLKEIDQPLYQEYIKEIFKETTGGKKHRKSSLYTKPTVVKKTKPLQSVQKHVDEILKDYERVCDLHDLHPCKKYIKSRKFPEYVDKILYYADDFHELAIKVNEKEGEKTWHEPRLIIPYFDFNGNLTLIQGRALGSSAMRYITIKKDSGVKKLYGCERVDRSKNVQVVEGPLDSLFIFNCVAVGDGSLLSCDFGNTFIPDNQSRNKEVVNEYKKIIDAGKNIVIWGDDWKYPGKDINEYVINGATIKEIHEYIGTHTYNGLNAKLKLADWKRI